MELLYAMVNEVNTRGHLQPLLKGKTVAVKIELTDKEPLFLMIDNEELQLTSTLEKDEDAYIAGDKEILESLLTGRLRLREAVKNNLLHFEGTFRLSLFLESLFSLAMLEQRILQENQTEIL